MNAANEGTRSRSEKANGRKPIETNLAFFELTKPPQVEQERLHDLHHMTGRV
jgi:hypothetical protein